MKQKKILLLGGSAQQVIAIEKAKEMGLYTVLCDYLPDNPGQYVADKFYQVSTTDVDALIEVAEKEQVDGVLAYASDPAALPAAKVAERLGLPTNPVKSVEILGVKHLFRHFLKDNGFAYPKFVHFNADKDLDELKGDIKSFHFPLIVKPTDSSGSKGVTKIESIDKLEDAVNYAKNYSRNNVLIVEEFIVRGFPDVIGGDIFVENSKIILFGEMSCLRGNQGKGLIPIGERWPSGLNERQTKRVHSELQRIVDALDIRFGELNLEIILDKEDNVYFLELGPRAGGNMIPIQLSDAFGIDLVKANVAVAMGVHSVVNPEAKPGFYMHYVLHSERDGVFEDVWFADEIKSHIYRECIYKKPGDKIETFDGAGKALGIVFLHFNDEIQMLEFCRNRNDLIGVILAD